MLKKLLTKLADDRELAVKKAVAANHWTSHEVLARLSFEDKEIRKIVEGNPTVRKLVVSASEATSPQTLSELAKSPLANVRETVAKYIL